MALININSHMTNVETYGDLVLRQASPMYTPELNTKLDYSDNPIGRIANISIPEMLKEYSNRNGKPHPSDLWRDHCI